MKTNPNTKNKTLREAYAKYKGEKFTRSTSTGNFRHSTLEVNQSVMQWLMNEGWIKVHTMDPSKNIWHNTYEVL